MNDISPPGRGLCIQSVIWIVGSISTFFITMCFFTTVSAHTVFTGILAGCAAAMSQTVFGIILYLYLKRDQRFRNRCETLLQESKEQSAAPAAVPPDVPSLSVFPAAEMISKPEIVDAERNIAVRTLLVRAVVRELCDFISHNLSSTTEPISEELLRIRTASTDFLNSIRSYEDEVKNRKTLLLLQTAGNRFNQDLGALSGTVRNVFSTLDEHLDSLKTVSERIGNIAADISEISEQIRILSFNASIEAARAGNAGMGFRVIAGEIKRLSADTGSRLNEIRETLRETQNIFKNIGTGLEENRQKMLDVVSKRQSGFDAFEHMLADYFPKLETLYTGVTGIIASLSKSMDVISPVVQLHEITSQEIGNLHLVADDFCGYIEEKTKTAFPHTVFAAEASDARNAVTDIRRRLTTEGELHALERGISNSVPDAAIDLAIDNREIELF